jgi:hypothetical protein
MFNSESERALHNTVVLLSCPPGPYPHDAVLIIDMLNLRIQLIEADNISECTGYNYQYLSAKLHHPVRTLVNPVLPVD